MTAEEAERSVEAAADAVQRVLNFHRIPGVVVLALSHDELGSYVGYRSNIEPVDVRRLFEAVLERLEGKRRPA